MDDTVLILDFDGVICDSICECLITSYNAFYQKNFTNISSIPVDIKNYFFQNRSFVRPAGEYYLLHKGFIDGVEIGSKIKFDILKDKYEKEIESFESKFFNERKNLKKNISNWLSLHKFYNHAKYFFNEYSSTFFIVTNKDKFSVERLTEYFGLQSKLEDIFSKEISNNKNILMCELLSKHAKKLEGKKLIYVDDNEWNLKDINSHKIKKYFATWGYSKIQETNTFEAIESLQMIFYSD